MLLYLFTIGVTRVNKERKNVHETVSEVVEVGESIKEVKVGDRIYLYPLYAKNDTKRAGTLGGFSEYMLLPKARLNHSYYMVPTEICDEVASLIEPFTVGGHAAKQGNPKQGEKAVIYGLMQQGLTVYWMIFWNMEKLMPDWF